MARPPKPWYDRGAWRTDFGGVRNRVLVYGPEDDATKRLAQTELSRLRDEARLLRDYPSMETPFAVVVERFLADYEGRVVYTDFSNELHWFMGADTSTRSEREGPPNRRGQNRPSGGRFGFPCRGWPIRRIDAQVVEQYLKRRKAAGLGGFHAYVALRTLMEWARRKRYIPSHDLDLVERSLRRRGRRKFLPEDQDVVRAFRATTGKFREFILVLMMTGMRTKEVRTVLIDEFDRERNQFVLWAHKVVEKTGLPKIVPVPTEAIGAVIRANAEGRERDQPLFLTDRGRPWTYQALRLRWRRLRDKLGLDSRFTLYSFRHWYLTMALEAGEDGAIVSELAGHADPASLEFYKKIRSRRLHEASRRVASAIERAGTGRPGEAVDPLGLDPRPGPADSPGRGDQP